MEALAVVRAVKPKIGMGVEFLDVEESSYSILERWIELVKRAR